MKMWPNENVQYCGKVPYGEIIRIPRICTAGRDNIDLKHYCLDRFAATTRGVSDLQMPVIGSLFGRHDCLPVVGRDCMVDGGNHAGCSRRCGPDSTTMAGRTTHAGHKLLVCEPLANPAPDFLAHLVYSTQRPHVQLPRKLVDVTVQVLVFYAVVRPVVTAPNQGPRLTPFR